MSSAPGIASSSRPPGSGHRLVVIDDHEIGWLEAAGAGVSAGGRWDILVLRHSHVRFTDRFRTRLQSLGAWRVIEPADLADEVHQRVNDFLLDLGAALPELRDAQGRLAADLTSSEGHLWWYLEVSERSPFRGRLVQQCYDLAMIRLALERAEYDEVWAWVSDPGLQEVLRDADGTGVPVRVCATRSGSLSNARRRDHRGYWSGVGLVLARFLAIRLLLAWLGIRAAHQPRATWFFTYFPRWWLEPPGGSPTERFFSRLPAGAAYLGWLTAPVDLWRARRGLRDRLGHARVVPLQAYLPLWEAAALADPRPYSRLVRLRRRLRGALSLPFCGFQVESLVLHEIDRSIRSSEVSHDRLLHRACRRFASRARPDALVYRSEFQPWEQALLTGIGDRTPSLGFLHAPYHRNNLPLRFAPGEIGRHLSSTSGSGRRVFPGGFLVCGGLGERHLRREGFPADGIAQCGPQRLGPFLDYLATRDDRRAIRQRLGWRADELVVFVAIAIVETDTEALFAALPAACAGLGAFRLVVKTHPNRPTGDEAMRDAMSALGPERAQLMPQAANMYDYIAAADAMVCIGSTIAFETMALGVMPVVFENPATYTLTSLVDSRDGLFVVRTVGELREALEAIRGNLDASRRRHHAWPVVLADAVGDLTRPLDTQMVEAVGALLGGRSGSEVRCRT